MSLRELGDWKIRDNGMSRAPRTPRVSASRALSKRGRAALALIAIKIFYIS